MTAETARRFELLEEQARKIMAVFTEADCELVAPAIIQPADIYLDVIGENLRSRTYVFTDPDGDELCLRPDLTVPVTRLYLERSPAADTRARYCYNGSAFRFQPVSANPLDPREFRQAGIELIGSNDRVAAEARVLELTLEAVKTVGLNNANLKFGDLGLFNALLEGLDIPDRWRARISENFWRKTEFHALLEQLSEPAATHQLGMPEELLKKLNLSAAGDAEANVASYLEEHGIPLIGHRSLSEITAHLLTIAQDAVLEPLSEDIVKFIQAYTSISAPPRAAGARIADLAAEAEISLDDALETYQNRLDKLAEVEIDLSTATFEAEFGRDLEYYTGFVFQLEVPDLQAGTRIAGGGRYDDLMSAVGAPHPVPAVGCAIHTERLLAAVLEQRE